MQQSSEKDIVVYAVEGGIAWVKYNRPEKRNAQSPALNRRMREVIDELEFRDDVGVLVLTGEGEAFCAGMDLKEYFRDTEVHGLKGTRHAQFERSGLKVAASRKRAGVKIAHKQHSKMARRIGAAYAFPQPNA